MKFASLFSGCGGFDLGFINKGFSHVGAYDSDHDACANFRENISKNITNIDLTNGIPDADKMYGVDALIAGPPCQGFSTAGKRVLNDHRNHLVTLTGEIALNVSPKVLVVENVPGALSGEHARYWNEMDSMMRHAGYHTHTLRCDTSKLGMAQHRKRILFFAWRTNRDIDFTMLPVATGSIRGALQGVLGLPNHKPRRLKDDTRDHMIAKRIKPGQKLSNVRGGVNAVATWDIPEVFGRITDNERTVLELLRRLRRQERERKHGDADPVSFERLESALGKQFHLHVENLIEKGYLRRIGNSLDLVGTFNGKYRRLTWDGLSHTVDTRFGSPKYFLHPSYHRGFTVREAARLQGFSDEYIYVGSERAQYRVIGNAVPPPLGEYAAEITNRLLGRPSC